MKRLYSLFSPLGEGKAPTDFKWLLALVLLIFLPLLALGFTAIKGVEAAQAQAQLSLESKLASLANQVSKRFLQDFEQQFSAQQQALAEPYHQGELMLALPYKQPFVYAFAVYEFEGDQRLRPFPDEASVALLWVEQQRLEQVEPSFISALNQLEALQAPAAGTLRWSALDTQPLPAGCWLGEDQHAHFCMAIHEEVMVQSLTQALLAQLKSETPSIKAAVFKQDLYFGDDFSGYEGERATQRLPAPWSSWQITVADSSLSVQQQHRYSRWLTLVMLGFVALVAAFAGLFLYSRYRWQQLHFSHQLAVNRQIAHDFKTPLANMMLYAQLIEQRKEHPQEVDDYCEIITQEVRRLEGLVAKGLKSDRVTAAEAVVPQVRFDEVCRTYSATLSSSGCSVLFGQQALAPSYFDTAVFDRIVVNLLDNACKYAQGAVITINSFYVADMLVVEIKDNGTHIDEAAVANIERALTEARPIGLAAMPGLTGTRIGLKGCRQLCEAQGGYLVVGYAEPGFRVQFALAAQIENPA